MSSITRDLWSWSKVTQPVCARKGCGFYDADCLCLVEAASDRPCNEGDARLCEFSNFISNGARTSRSHEHVIFFLVEFCFPNQFHEWVYFAMRLRVLISNCVMSAFSLDLCLCWRVNAIFEVSILEIFNVSECFGVQPSFWKIPHFIERKAWNS